MLSYKSLSNFLHKLLYSILEGGTKHIDDVIVKHRVTYFNAIILALPLVYVVFVLMDLSSYIVPLNTWLFDQWGFFIFVAICIISYALNYLKRSSISRALFILSWPAIMHIIPIIIQKTPSDYYYAFPMGLVFHSIMIQVLFCSKKSPFYFWTLLGANFILTLYSIEFLQYFDIDELSAIGQIAAEEYYSLVIILYWLLFNLVVYYLMRIVDNNVIRTLDSKNIIEKQNKELEHTLEKLRKSQNQLLQSEKLASLGVFTAGISHELNNPINFISSGASGLFSILDSLYEKSLKGNPDYERELQNIEIIRRAIENGVDRTISIVSSLRNYTNPGEEGFFEYNCVNCIRDSIILLSDPVKDRIQIKEDFPEEINLVCNAGKINQAFFNLLNNAVYAISGKGEIHITARISDNDKAIFEFKDTGCGIDAQNIKNLFDPFFTTKDIGKGTGLGLFIVHSIVEEHKGSIEVESELNKGSLFRVILPTNLIP